MAKNKYIFFSGLLIVFLAIFFYPVKIAAQPLDPSLPGYEEVRPPQRPSLKIISPQNNTTILGPQLKIEYLAGGIKLVATEEARSTGSGQAPRDIRGEGHIKIIFAKLGFPVPTPIETARKSPITFENIPEGDYRVTIEVVKNSGKSYSPRVEETTRFKVAAPITPTATLTPTPTPTPIPFRDKIPISNNELILVLGTILIVSPAVFLVLKKLR
jgi:hypothetical protein